MVPFVSLVTEELEPLKTIQTFTENFQEHQNIQSQSSSPFVSILKERALLLCQLFREKMDKVFCK